MSRINREQLHALLNYARFIKDTRLAALVMRTLDGDSLYHNSMLERCTAIYQSAHSSDEFRRAQEPAKDRAKKAPR
jgi:hypothetical protein